jgi:hypothetical protein
VAVTEYEEDYWETESKGEREIIRKSGSEENCQEEVTRHPIAHLQDLQKVLTLQEELKQAKGQGGKEQQR